MTLTNTDLVKVSELFKVIYGHSLEYNRFEEDLDKGVNFISRTAKNNGISGKIIIPASQSEKIVPLEPPFLSVALGGSVLSTFVQLEAAVAGRDIQLLQPLTEMSIEEMLFYATMIEANKWRYSFGRQANKTLKDLLIPRQIPEKWKGKLNDVNMSNFSEPRIIEETPKLDISKFESFLVKDLFKISKGNYSIPEHSREQGTIPLVSASQFNNGVTGHVKVARKDVEKYIFPAGSLTIAQNGTVGVSFLQAENFCATSDIAVLVPQTEYSIFSLIYLAQTLEHAAVDRFHYGFKLNTARLNNLSILLPAKLDDEENKIVDTEFIERFMKTLKWSNKIEE